MDIDAVITYVDNTDPEWISTFSEYRPSADSENMPSRYRDFGTLQFLLRGISKNMPWIRNVYLVVCDESQVPWWVNTDNVHVVLHRDIIPEKFLPTFNSTTIESYMYRIPGLAEHFIYFNDDMFPLRKMYPGDFFIDGHPIVCVKERDMTESFAAKASVNPALMMYSTAYKFVTSKLGIPAEPDKFLILSHTAQAFRKSTFGRIHNLYEDEIEQTITRFRDPKNLSQFTYSLYEFFSGGAIVREPSYAYLRLCDNEIQKNIYWILTSKMWKTACVNDITSENESALDFYTMKQSIQMAFGSIYPSPSEYDNAPSYISKNVPVPQDSAIRPHYGFSTSAKRVAFYIDELKSGHALPSWISYITSIHHRPSRIVIYSKSDEPLRGKLMPMGPEHKSILSYKSDDGSILHLSSIDGTIYIERTNK